MALEVKVPVLPESVSDATIATWHKKAGDAVKRDENLVDLETDKVVLEVPAAADGVLKEIRKETGATVTRCSGCSPGTGQSRSAKIHGRPRRTSGYCARGGEDRRTVTRRPARRNREQDRPRTSGRHRSRRSGDEGRSGQLHAHRPERAAQSSALSPQPCSSGTKTNSWLAA